MGELALLGTIRPVGYYFIEKGWLPCDGRLLLIAQYERLFALLGTMYGGDGQTTFALPDLRSRALAGENPDGANQYGIPIRQGEQLGAENVVLTEGQMPAHTHLLSRKNNTNRADKISVVSPNASLNFLGGVEPDGTIEAIQTFYNPDAPNPPPAMDRPFAPGAIGVTGQAMPHENRQPFLAVNYLICVEGIFPIRPN